MVGALHVDDLAVFSKVWCHKCLTKLTQRSFPSDLGFQVEEVGPTPRVLSLIVDINVDSNIRLFPNNANILFGLGIDMEQRILRLGPFHDAGIQLYKSSASLQDAFAYGFFSE